jgi:hypothetical protein
MTTDAHTFDWAALRRELAALELPAIHRSTVRCPRPGCGRWCLEAFSDGRDGLYVASHVDLPHLDVDGARWEDMVLAGVDALDRFRQPATGNRRIDLSRLWALNFVMRGLLMLAPGDSSMATITVKQFPPDHPAVAVVGQCLQHRQLVDARLSDLRSAVLAHHKIVKASTDA